MAPLDLPVPALDAGRQGQGGCLQLEHRNNESARDTRIDLALDGSLLASLRFFDSVILDIGNVVLHYNANGAEPLLRTILADPLWCDLEINGIGAHEAYARIAAAHGLTPDVVDGVLARATAGVTADETMITFIECLRALDKEVVCLSNMPKVFYSALRECFDFWNHFSAIYVSSEIGVRKPDIEAYEYVIERSCVLPERSLVIDDREENIQSAKFLGFEAIRFETAARLFDTLRGIGKRMGVSP